MSELSYFQSQLTEPVQTAVVLKPPFPFTCHEEMHFYLRQFITNADAFFIEKYISARKIYHPCHLLAKCS